MKEKQSAQIIVSLLAQRHTEAALEAVRDLQDELFAAIPASQRRSRGITWVLQCITQLLVAECNSPAGWLLDSGVASAGRPPEAPFVAARRVGGGPEQVRFTADTLYKSLPSDDMRQGIPIFLMAEYGKTHPSEVLGFFAGAAGSDDWIIREFAAAGFRKLITPCREVALPWLKQTARSDNPRLRRFVGETLRPVTDLRWLNDEPETSLEILRLLFRETHPYPRTSVGNNLSDLARRNPDLILAIVKELVESGDRNGYWIAYRACRNLVRRNPERVMDLLGVDEYHYKNRHFYRPVLARTGQGDKQ